MFKIYTLKIIDCINYMKFLIMLSGNQYQHNVHVNYPSAQGRNYCWSNGFSFCHTLHRSPRKPVDPVLSSWSEPLSRLPQVTDVPPSHLLGAVLTPNTAARTIHLHGAVSPFLVCHFS